MFMFVLTALYAVSGLSEGDACNLESECPSEFPCLYNVETYEVRVRTPDRTNWIVTETINGKEYEHKGKFTKDEVQKMIDNGGVAVKERPCMDLFEPMEIKCICMKKVEIQDGGNATHPDTPTGSNPDDNNTGISDGIASAVWSVTKAILSILLLLFVIGLILFCLHAKRENIYAMFNKLESSSGHVDTRGESSAKTMPVDKSKNESLVSHKKAESKRATTRSSRGGNASKRTSRKV